MDQYKPMPGNIDNNNKINALIEIEKSCEQLLLLKNKVNEYITRIFKTKGKEKEIKN
jgi:hypothetical protein